MPTATCNNDNIRLEICAHGLYSTVKCPLLPTLGGFSFLNNGDGGYIKQDLLAHWLGQSYEGVVLSRGSRVEPTRLCFFGSG